MSTLVGATLVLENCETIDFDASDITNLWIQNLHYNLRRCDAFSIHKECVCDQMYIELSPNANKPYMSFAEPSELYTFERLTKCNDITAIELVFNDGTREYCRVPWDYRSFKEINTYQTSLVEPAGCLCILISRTNTVDKFLKAIQNAPYLIESALTREGDDE